MDDRECCVCHNELEKDYIHIVYYNEHREKNMLERSFVDSRNICKECYKKLYDLLKGETNA